MNEKNLMIRFTEVLKDNPDHAYDFICQNAWKMSKDELKDIIKELLYGIHTVVLKSEHDEILQSVADELNEQYQEA